MARAAAQGVEFVRLSGKRLALGLPDEPRAAYAQAKAMFLPFCRSALPSRLHP